MLLCGRDPVRSKCIRVPRRIKAEEDGGRMEKEEVEKEVKFKFKQSGLTSSETTESLGRKQ